MGAEVATVPVDLVFGGNPLFGRLVGEVALGRLPDRCGTLSVGFEFVDEGRIGIRNFLICIPRSGIRLVNIVIPLIEFLQFSGLGVATHGAAAGVT